MPSSETDSAQRSTVLRYFRILATTDSPSFRGAEIAGYLYTSRFTQWTATYDVNNADIKLSDNTIILSIAAAESQATVDPIDLKYLIVNSTGQTDNTGAPLYESSAVAKADIDTFLTGVVNNISNNNIFFDSMYYYMRNASFVTTNSVTMPNSSVLDFYNIIGSIRYYTPGIAYADFINEIITNIYSYVALPIRRPTDSGRYDTGQIDEFVTGAYSFAFLSDNVVIISKPNDSFTPITLIVNSSGNDFYIFPGSQGTKLKLVKNPADGFPLFETSIIGAETPAKSTILRKVTIVISGTNLGANNGRKIEAYVYVSRINSWAYNITSSHSDIGDGNFTKPIQINQVDGSQVATIDDNLCYAITNTSVNSSEISKYISGSASKVEIDTFLTTINFHNSNGYSFIDSMYYYMRSPKFATTNSLIMPNADVAANLYGGTTKTIWYYQDNLTYSDIKTAILANNNNNTYHALPIRKPTDSSRYGDDPDHFNITGAATYTITTANDYSVSFIKNSGTAETININGIYEFDSGLSLKLVLNPDYGFPLFEVYSATTTTTAATTVPCLLKGTRVLTPSGYKLIESLSVEDMILNNYNQPVSIRKISKSVVTWSENPTLDKMVFKTPGYQPTFLTGWHRIRRQDGTFLKAYDCGFDLAKKEEICSEDGVFVIYHLNVDDWQNNNLVVNGGTVVESWSGMYT